MVLEAVDEVGLAVEASAEGNVMDGDKNEHNQKKIGNKMNLNMNSNIYRRKIRSKKYIINSDNREKKENKTIKENLENKDISEIVEIKKDKNNNDQENFYSYKCVNKTKIFSTKNNNNSLTISVTLLNDGKNTWTAPCFFSCMEESYLKGERVKIKNDIKPNEKCSFYIKVLI